MKVTLTRSADIDLSLSARPKIANNIKADLFVSIHANSASNKLARGLETFSQIGRANDVKFAKILNDELWASGLFYANRGIKTADFQVLRDSKVPAILTELGFISNDKDRETLMKEYKNMAKAIANAIKKMNVKSVVIDAGHGGKDSGAVGGDVYEKTYTLAIAKEVARLLQETTTTQFKWTLDYGGGGVFHLGDNIYERNNPTLKDRAGMKLRKKGEAIEYTHYLINEGFVWLKQRNGKVIPWKVHKGEEWGVIKDFPTLKVGAKVQIVGSKYATGEVVPDWVKKRTYEVNKIDGDKVRLATINSWVYSKDVKVV